MTKVSNLKLHTKKKKNSNEFFFAEGGGFEPPVRLPVRQFSKLLVSATHPSFPILEKRIATKQSIHYDAFQ